MTEAEWLKGACPQDMVHMAAAGASPRKLRLLFAALLPPVSHFDTSEPPPETTLTQLADGQITHQQAISQLERYRRVHPRVDLPEHVRPVALLMYRTMCGEHPQANAANHVRHLVELELSRTTAFRTISIGESHLLRDRIRLSVGRLVADVLGNPFRPVAFDPRWRTPDAIALAHAIYDDRAFDRLPLLADALMDAGCDDAEVIGHCRGRGPHVRGCWVVDLVLGKS